MELVRGKHWAGSAPAKAQQPSERIGAAGEGVCARVHVTRKHVSEKTGLGILGGEDLGVG